MRKWAPNSRQFILRGLGTLLAIALIFILVKEEGWDQVRDAFRELTMTRFLAGLGLMLISRLFVATRWYVLLRSGGRVSFPEEMLSLTYEPADGSPAHDFHGHAVGQAQPPLSRLAATGLPERVKLLVHPDDLAQGNDAIPPGGYSLPAEAGLHERPRFMDHVVRRDERPRLRLCLAEALQTTSV